LFNEFKQFILRGNVVELAVAVVIGAAFGSVVTAFVEDFITPLIAALGGQPDFSALDFTINNSTFRYGHFINALLSFLIIAAVIFFFVVQPMNYLVRRMNQGESPDPTTRKCPYCVSEITIKAQRCAFCISEVEPLQAVTLE